MFVKIPLRVPLWQRLSFPFLVGGLIGCSSLVDLGNALPFKNYPITPIIELPEQNQGSTIYLQGKVSKGAPFLESGAYQLQDNTGAVWVRTTQQLPNPGQELIIKGQVDYQSIPVGSTELGEFYILELEQVGHQLSSEKPPKPATKPIDDLLLDHKQQQK